MTSGWLGLLGFLQIPSVSVLIFQLSGACETLDCVSFPKDFRRESPRPRAIN